MGIWRRKTIGGRRVTIWRERRDGAWRYDCTLDNAGVPVEPHSCLYRSAVAAMADFKLYYERLLRDA
jgi:hypothetical protein